MLETVDVGSRTLASYRGVAPAHIIESLKKAAEGLRGARVLHVNATPYGGGVSELLRSVVPLESDLGLVADWRIIRGDERFFQATKAMHNGLQGAPKELTEEQKATYLASAEENARAFNERYDFVFVHDPQPAAMLSIRGKDSARWIWRCHIDTSEPNPQVWAFLRPFLTDYDAAVFTMKAFAPPDMPTEKIEIIPPGIDPASPKNLRLPRETARQVLEWLGVRTDRPLVTQISRFDPWKDPLGVVRRGGERPLAEEFGPRKLRRTNRRLPGRRLLFPAASRCHEQEVALRHGEATRLGWCSPLAEDAPLGGECTRGAPGDLGRRRKPRHRRRLSRGSLARRSDDPRERRG